MLPVLGPGLTSISPDNIKSRTARPQYKSLRLNSFPELPTLTGSILFVIFITDVDVFCNSIGDVAILMLFREFDISTCFDGLAILSLLLEMMRGEGDMWQCHNPILTLHEIVSIITRGREREGKREGDEERERRERDCIMSCRCNDKTYWSDEYPIVSYRCSVVTIQV